MPADVLGRQVEQRTIAQFLDSIRRDPAGLLLLGEAGVGKTTLWQASVTEAVRRGYTVLSCRPSQSEAKLSYASVADLLADVPVEILGQLPTPQRGALDAVLLRAGAPPAAIDHRLVATAFLNVLRILASHAPVVVAVDDFHWLDRASALAIEFAARRLSGSLGILVSVRADSQRDDIPRIEVHGVPVNRVEIKPLSLAVIHQILRDRMGRTYRRPVLLRIYRVSGGNPFFAQELARMLRDADVPLWQTRFPESLAQITGARFEGLDSRARELLLAAAALAEPTVEILQRIGGPSAAASLEQAENLGIIELIGPQVRFVHPILASAVYGTAPPAERRAIHHRLAGAGLEIEERARHLALAATGPDAETIDALDAAAESATKRGAPAVAAELIDLALQLGARTAGRNIRAAACHFDAGDPMRARALLEEAIAGSHPGGERAEALLLLARVRIHDDSYHDAARLLEIALSDAATAEALQVKVEVELSFALFNLGRLADALIQSEHMVAAAERLGDPHLIAQALAMASAIKFMAGHGLDEPAIERALSLERVDPSDAMNLRPSLVASLIWMWLGRLDRARERLESLHRECLERGAEQDLVFLGFHMETLACWRGDLASARAIASDSHERALELGTEVPLALALSSVAHAAALSGDAEQARQAAQASLEIFQRAALATVGLVPPATLGFLELSLDNYEAAAARLAPMATHAIAVGVREPSIVPFAPDAAEALVAVGRIADATVIVQWLEDHGLRLDRAWAIASGGRCRSMLLAAQGELGAAIRCCQKALADHERIPMPFEKARTLLVMGRLQRRAGKRREAKAALVDSLEIFDRLGTRLWAEKANRELGRLGIRVGRSGELTPSEQRVAELAGTGRTNKEVAAALSVSPKTVEANLARIYQKLNIRSRAELGRWMADLPSAIHSSPKGAG
jgi:DNA-binding CsgD family transcriptional regulator